MALLLGALTVGLILSLLALGVYVSFRVFSFADITADGSITLGAAVAAILVVHHVHPIWAMLVAAAAGAAAGATTGVIHTRFGIDRLLSGILVMTALYSINLHVMGKSIVPLLGERTLALLAEQTGSWLAGGTGDLTLWGWAISIREAFSSSASSTIVPIRSTLARCTTRLTVSGRPSRTDSTASAYLRWNAPR